MTARPILVFDVETTGLPPRGPVGDLSLEPRVVQLAFSVQTPERELYSASVLVRPSGWTIPDGAAKVHGITTELAARWGHPPKAVISRFCALAAREDIACVVAHNLDFDRRLINVECQRHGLESPFRQASGMSPLVVHCTMGRAIEDVKARHRDEHSPDGDGRGFDGSWKYPKLSECYEHYFGRALEGAHDAMVDVRACAEIYWRQVGG